MGRHASDQVRKMDTRTVATRPETSGIKKTQLYIDPSALDASRFYKWVRYQIENEIDRVNISRHQAAGWEFVKSSQLPKVAGYNMKLPWESASQGEDFIRRGTNILMSIPQHVAKQMKEEQHAAADQASLLGRSFTDDDSAKRYIKRSMEIDTNFKPFQED